MTQINRVKKWDQFLNENARRHPRPIKKLIINGMEINSKTDWKELYDSDKKAEFYAYDLFINYAYPTYLRTEVENRYGVQDWVIIPNTSLEYKKQMREHPEYFEYDKYEYDIKNRVFTKKF